MAVGLTAKKSLLKKCSASTPDLLRVVGNEVLRLDRVVDLGQQGEDHRLGDHHRLGDRRQGDLHLVDSIVVCPRGVHEVRLQEEDPDRLQEIFREDDEGLFPVVQAPDLLSGGKRHRPLQLEGEGIVELPPNLINTAEGIRILFRLLLLIFLLTVYVKTWKVFKTFVL